MSFRSQSRSSRARRIAPWGIFSSVVEKTVAYSLSPGQGAALAFRSAGIICRVALSGLLRRPAPTARKGPLAGKAPSWPLCTLCVSALNTYMKAAPKERLLPWWDYTLLSSRIRFEPPQICHTKAPRHRGRASLRSETGQVDYLCSRWHQMASVRLLIRLWLDDRRNDHAVHQYHINSVFGSHLVIVDFYQIVPVRWMSRYRSYFDFFDCAYGFRLIELLDFVNSQCNG
jgi:hypothetical protein